MNVPPLPENVARISPGESFSFLCHPDVQCFTHCCRQLELALTPYDVLRLRQATGLSSEELLDKYIIIEQDGTDIFPRYYLSMVDDGQASCVFVGKDGCAVYQHRPGACRTYPLGRGVSRGHNNTVNEFFVLLREPHCLGFSEKTVQTIDSYNKSQDLERYNFFNDMLTEIQQHPKIRSGMRLTTSQGSDYRCALYNIDAFRKIMAGNTGDDGRAIEALDDETLLIYAFSWLKNKLFGSKSSESATHNARRQE